MPVYFIRSKQVTQQGILLDADLEHHLGNVLRLKTGETIRLVDETPRQYLARVLTTRPDPITLKIESETLRPARNSPKIRLCVAMINRDKMDWIVQKTTELGISRISPILTDRTVVRPDPARALRQVTRWKKIAKEAAQQSCRWDVPDIDPAMPLDKVLNTEKKPGFRFIFSEQCPVSGNKYVIQKIKTIKDKSGMFLIGPEGGWTASELRKAESHGFVALSLGESILRTETASVSALAILQYELSDGTT